MLAEMIRANQPCVVLTGAGVSTESGIPDFRSATGIWARYDPHEVASIEAFAATRRACGSSTGAGSALLARRRAERGAPRARRA